MVRLVLSLAWRGLCFFVLMLTMDVNRFTGPKITLSADELTIEQQEALEEEGLDVQVETAAGTQKEDIRGA